MILDRNKGITNIEYNHLNLPTKVTINGNGNTGTIDYIYDAAGIKLKKIVTEGSSLTQTEYAGNYIYENSQLQFFNHAEGYVEPNGSSFDYIYQCKDHLGNVRLSYADTNGDGIITASTEIREENNYYPFGLKHRGYNSGINGRDHKFEYNGIELEESLGYNMMEMGVRSFDPAIARWVVQDPVIHYSLSPYNAFDNNPIYWADPSGADSDTFFQSSFLNQNGGHWSDGLYGESSGNEGSSENDGNGEESQESGNCCGGNIFSKLFKSVSNFIQSIGSDPESEQAQDELANVNQTMNGLQEGIRSANTILSSGDIFGMAPIARLGVALTNGDISVDEYYTLMNEYLGTNNSAGGDTFAAALFFVPGGNQTKIALKSGRGLWVLTKGGSSAIKNHKTFGAIFKSSSDGLWWAIDKAGHGGSRFKVFKEGKKGLEWFRDADEFGDFIINKHKGSTGKLIPWGHLKTVK